MEKVCILGAGAMAGALGGALAREGARLALYARRPARARGLRGEVLAAAPGCARRVRAEPDLRAALLDADLVLFCVSDRSIGELAGEAAEVWIRGGREPVCVHTSGFLGIEELRPLADLGLAAGVLHPLVALPPKPAPNSPPRWTVLRGAWYRVLGQGRARKRLRALVRALQGRELRLSAEGDAALYHASAALLAGGAVALFDAALELMQGAGASQRSARAALLGLLETTVTNLEAPPAAALTGPAARGDAEVVEGHLEVLERSEDLGGARAIYAALTERMLELAGARGTAGESECAAIRARLRRSLS